MTWWCGEYRKEVLIEKGGFAESESADVELYELSMELSYS